MPNPKRKTHRFSSRKRSNGFRSISVQRETDDDEDYVPNLPSGSSTKKTKRPPSKAVKCRRPKRVKRCSKASEVQSPQRSSCSIEFLPPEILLQIFQYIIGSHGDTYSLMSLSQVCQRWRVLSGNPSLWRITDLSPTALKGRQIRHTTFRSLCRAKLSLVRVLSLNGCKFFTDEWATTISKNCPLLESLDLSGCFRLRWSGLRDIVDHCKHLTSLYLASLKESSAISKASLQYVITTIAARLQCLDLSQNSIKSFNTIFNNYLLPCCPNLNHLDISNCTFNSSIHMNIDAFQKSCPKMQRLMLAQCPIQLQPPQFSEDDAQEGGFPDLEELSIAGISSVDCQFFILKLLTKQSTQLRLLDIRFCQWCEGHTLDLLPYRCIERIYLSKAQCKDISVVQWLGTLKEVHMSWLDGTEFGKLLKDLTVLENKVEVLDLRGTPITDKQLMKLLLKSPQLQYIDVSSCRYLSRGLKKRYETNDFPLLKEKLRLLKKAT